MSGGQDKNLQILSGFLNPLNPDMVERHITEIKSIRNINMDFL